MGDNRDAGRAPGAAPAAEKKAPDVDAGGGAGAGPVPDGAAANPESALTLLEANYGPQLVGMLQSAAGNVEVDAELSSLRAGQQVAAQAKAEQDAFDTMTDGQKLEKYGGKGGAKGGGGAAPAEGGKREPPPGVAQPADVQTFHANRAGELQGLAGQHATVAGTLTAASAAPGLSPEIVAFLTAGAAQSAAQQTALTGLAASYAEVGASLAGSQYIGAAMPGQEAQGLYEVRIGALQGVVGTMDSMVGEFDSAIAAEQAKITDCDTQIADLMTQLTEAAAAAKNAAAAKGDAKGPGAGAAPKEESKGPGSAPPGQEAKPAPGAAKKGDSKGGEAKGGKGGDSKSSSAGSTGNLGLGPSPDAAEKKAAPAPDAAAGGGPGAAPQVDPTIALTKQIETQKTKKQAIEQEIASHQSFIGAVKAVRDQLNNLVAAYTGGSTPPSGGGG